MTSVVEWTESRVELPLGPAPGAERYSALDFANSLVTTPGDGTVDALVTPAAAGGWLAERGLVPEGTELQEFCAGRLTTLREDVRALLHAVVGCRRPESATLRAINEAMTLTPTAELLRWDPQQGLSRVSGCSNAQAVEHAMATLAADAAALVTGPDAGRLAACGAPSCNRLLIRTHARRHWCSVRCGDRVRAARAYARRTA
jgi:predicted RNA-binding Zn ribbon-like protein